MTDVLYSNRSETPYKIPCHFAILGWTEAKTFHTVLLSGALYPIIIHLHRGIEGQGTMCWSCCTTKLEMPGNPGHSKHLQPSEARRV